MVAGLMITIGTLGDRTGPRRLLLTGAAGFGVGSVLAASRACGLRGPGRAIVGPIVGGCAVSP